MQLSIDLENIVPTADGSPDLESLRAALERVGAGESVTLALPSGERIVLPDEVTRVLRVVVGALSLGEALSLVPNHKEFSTQEAADFLNVSRSYLARLLEEGSLSNHLAGSRRKIYFADLLEFKKQQDDAQRKGMQELLELSQQYGLYELADEPMPKIRRRRPQSAAS